LSTLNSSTLRIWLVLTVLPYHLFKEGVDHALFDFFVRRHFNSSSGIRIERLDMTGLGRHGYVSNVEHLSNHRPDSSVPI
jgi:hypothetical protein